MVDLNNIFNKFFPKAQTSPTGKKLIYMAWAIEITVALVGFTIAASFIMLGREEVANATGEVSSSANIEYVIIALAFFVVGIMELTKIPLATALYYSVRTFWKIVFLFALLAVNFSTFETIIQGFELAFNQRSKVVDLKRKELEDLKNQKLTISEEQSFEGDIDKEIDAIQSQISILNQSIVDIDLNANNQIAELEKQNSLANPKRDSLQAQIDDENKKLENLRNTEKELSLSLQNVKGFLQGGTRKDIEERIVSIKESIIGVENNIQQLRNQLDQVLGASASKNIPQIEAIRDNAQLRKNQIQKQIDNIVQNQLTPKQDEKSRIAQKQGSLNEELISLQELIDQKSKEVDDVAGDNQIYRLAVKIKVLLSDDSTAEFSESDLTQEDIDRAFWIWFGFLAFVISVIGTFVALAGLHLMDERMHEIRNQPINRKNTLRYRIGRFFVSLSKYFSTQVKIMMKPKTIEKIIEKEVEVEKIVEKPVYQDRIVHVDREVPKETIVKEMVYVPLPTDDTELLKKGPFKANDYNDKAKKK